MHISVILATYKRPEILLRTLQSFSLINTKGLEWELLLVDNADHEPSRKVALSFISQLPLSYLVEKNPGKNNALNHAIKKAKGELFIFTDDDILAEPSWLHEMWAGYNRWPDHSLFGGRILPDFPPGKVPIPPDHRFYNQAYTVANWDLKEGPYQANMVWGPNMAVRRKVFDLGWCFQTSVGPNGKDYIMGSETEFTTRMESVGFIPVYLPKSLVYHQIRPEQLKMEWLYGRAYRAGRSQAYRTGLSDAQTLFGVPKHLWMSLIIIGIKRRLMFFHKTEALDLGVHYYKIKGMIYQYRNGVAGRSAKNSKITHGKVLK